MDIATGFRLEILTIDPEKNNFPSQLLQSLQQFSFQHYSHQDPNQFKNIVNFNEPGDLALFYDYSNRLIGFTRLTIQKLRNQGRDITVFLGATYQDPLYNLTYTVAKFGLVQAMKYKLGHPEQELVVFSNVNTPEKYQFLANMSEIFYPKPGVRTPDNVLTLVQQLKKYNQWTSESEHPMLIDNQLAPVETSSSNPMPANEFRDYYLAINPNYKSGTSLLVYLPLNLATIGHGMKQVVSQFSTL